MNKEFASYDNYYSMYNINPKYLGKEYLGVKDLHLKAEGLNGNAFPFEYIDVCVDERLGLYVAKEREYSVRDGGDLETHQSAPREFYSGDSFLIGKDGSVLVSGSMKEIFDFVSYIISKNKKADIKTMREMMQVMAQMIACCPQTIQEVPVALATAFPEFKKEVLSKRKEIVLEEVDKVPAGESVKHIYEHEEKIAEMFASTFKAWKDKIKNVNAEKRATLKLYSDLDAQYNI